MRPTVKKVQDASCCTKAEAHIITKLILYRVCRIWNANGRA